LGIGSQGQRHEAPEGRNPDASASKQQDLGDGPDAGVTLVDLMAILPSGSLHFQRLQ
jgi:hypothetical protein